MNELNDDDIPAKVKVIFTEYLKKHNLRKTPERYVILDTVYSIDGHFDVETLYNKVNGFKYRICRATLYNTIELLLDCNLIIEHTFGNVSLSMNILTNVNNMVILWIWIPER